MAKIRLSLVMLILISGCSEDKPSKGDSTQNMNAGGNPASAMAGVKSPTAPVGGDNSDPMGGESSSTGGMQSPGGQMEPPSMAGMPTMPMGGMTGGMMAPPMVELPPASPVPADLSESFADAICGYLGRCNYQTLVETLLNEGCEQFMARQFEDQTIERLKPYVDDDKIRYVPANTQRCLDALAELECSADIDRLAASCADGFVGTSLVDEACTINEMCWGESFCNPDGSCPGKCESKRPEGEICDDVSWCQSGLLCVRGICKPPSQLDEPCGGDKPSCIAGLYCTGQNGDAGVCRVFDTSLKPEGDECNIQAGPLCQSDLSCVPKVSGLSIRFRCEARVGEGEECHPGLPEHCQDGLYCAGTDLDRILAPDLDGTCRPLPADGERCGDAPIGKVCAQNLVCNGGTCSARIRIAGECREDGACYSGQCVAGQCGHSNLCPTN